jgi:TPR repeat protein
MICSGCIYESRLQEAEQKCPFCRTPYPKDEADADRMLKKRIAVNDPFAIRGVAGRWWREGNFSECFKYMKQAAEGGDMEAHQQLGHMYFTGEGVEEDMKKAIYHFEEAAIGGHPIARLSLGVIEGDCGRHERQVKHFVIAANQGLDDAMNSSSNVIKKAILAKMTLERLFVHIRQP